MTNRFAPLLAVFESTASHTSLNITGKRRALIIEALQLAAAYEEAMNDKPDETQTADTVFSVSLFFQHKRIADMVSTALDTPVGDWFLRASVSQPADRSGISTKEPFYSQAPYWGKPDACLRCVVDNPVNDSNGKTIVKSLVLQDFIRALAMMATKDDGAYSRHFADFLSGNEDANTADLFMQLAIYGEEVYA